MALIVAPPGTDRPWPERGGLGLGKLELALVAAGRGSNTRNRQRANGLTQAGVEAREAARCARSKA